MSGPSRLSSQSETASASRHRSSFLVARERLREQARRYAAIWGLAVLVAGLPLSAVLTPLLFLLLLLLTRTISFVVPLPETVGAWLHAVAALVPHLLETLFADRFDLGEAWRALVATLPTLVPGLVAMATLAWRLQSVIIRGGTEIVARELSARAIDPDSAQETELEQIAEELALAAGVSTPDVRILDLDYPNAAALGSSPDEATLLITRGLLDSFDREEIQGAMSHLIAAIANGDGRLALQSVALIQAFGLVLTALDAFLNLSRSALRDLRVATVALLRGRPPSAEVASRLLALAAPRKDGITALVADAVAGSPRTAVGRALRRIPPLWLLLLPLLLLAAVLLLIRLALGILRLFVVEPLVMLASRSRRYQADSTAVQLTGNPDGLARALLQLANRGTAPGGATFSDLFLVGSEAVTARAQAELQAAMARARHAGGEGGPPWRHVATNLEGQKRASRQYLDAVAAAEEHTPGWRIFGPRPPLNQRLERLQAMGARVEALSTGAQRRRRWLAGLILLPMFAVATPIISFVVGMTLLLGGGAATLVAGGAMHLIEILLR